MSGADGQAGYVFQQDYMAFRILGSEATRLLLPSQTSQAIAAFKVEGIQTAPGPVWDVSWVLENGSIHLRECKDTAIGADDRRGFYRRIRREIASGTQPELLYVGWVTDPGKQTGRILHHIREMVQLAAAEALNFSEPPEEVSSGRTALCEALHCLSCETGSDTPPIPESVARDLLTKLRVDAHHAEGLAAAVEELASSVFQCGTGRLMREYIQGVFSTTIQQDRVVECDREQFLANVGSIQLMLELPEVLREIIRFNSGGSTVPTHGLEWTQPELQRQRLWALSERIPALRVHESVVLVAGTGVGKTTCSLQVRQEQLYQRAAHHVLHISVGDTTVEVIRVLPRLCSLLCGVSRTWLAIDGLDQTQYEMQTDWRQSIRRLLSIPHLTLLVTARREVLAAYDWMKELLSGLPEVLLQPLAEDQVKAEFEQAGLPVPKSKALIECLRNPYLFSVYARTVSTDDLPLSDRGEVTAFDVIRVYWERRIVTDSQGIRSVCRNSGHAKRAAVTYLANLTLHGESVFERPLNNQDLSNGIEMLCREGALIADSATAVRWFHAWLQEFAVTDYLVGKIATPRADTIAALVADIEVEHAARIAATGCCKWIVANPGVGSTDEFIIALFDKSPALGREALTVLLEDSPNNLILARLTAGILIEAMSIARIMRMWQWQQQVAALPTSLFLSDEGTHLQHYVVLYETEMASNA